MGLEQASPLLGVLSLERIEVAVERHLRLDGQPAAAGPAAVDDLAQGELAPAAAEAGSAERLREAALVSSRNWVA